MIGNAVSVPVAEWLGERLASPYSWKYNAGTRDQAFQPAPASSNSLLEVSAEAACQVSCELISPPFCYRVRLLLTLAL